jgi:radical SAM C-methyltransferase
MSAKIKRHVALVQQGVWDTPLESMPLASGYLKAMIDSDPDIGSEVSVNIVNFRGGATVPQMAQTLFAVHGPPDVLAFSVAGWNFQQFGALAETFRQLRLDGWVVMGGPHVANQASRVFQLFPWVDIVVNGEGEYVFREVLAEYLSGTSPRGLAHIDGISYRNPSGTVETTAESARITDLDSIPSPFLSGALPLADQSGRLPYDVALMETSRGCPYKCAFCYWGGAVGQKMRSFSRERLREELRLFAKRGVDTIVLCDSNFGMRPADAEFLEDFISIREQYGYPNALETSWAKNKSEVFRGIVKTMQEANLKSSFTLALQTLSDSALDMMKRRNMRLNQWQELVSWLRNEGLDCYAELIWGAPGETSQSFLEGYDHLAEFVPRIATYPLLLLPNTAYREQRQQFGIVTVRGKADDFEYVLAHSTMSLSDNRRMQKFLLWARVAAENLFFRHIWHGLRQFAGFRQSDVLTSLGDWFETHADTDTLRASEMSLADPDCVPNALRELYSAPNTNRLLMQWWGSDILPTVPLEAQTFVTDIFLYDLLTRPIFDEYAQNVADLTSHTEDGTSYYLSNFHSFAYEPETIAAYTTIGRSDFAGAAPPPPSPCELRFRHRAGFREHLANHEMAAHFLGSPFEVRPVEQIGRRQFTTSHAADQALLRPRS